MTLTKLSNNGSNGSHGALAAARSKVANPLFAPYLGAGATEAQLAVLLKTSTYSERELMRIATHMQAPLPASDAAALVEWVEELRAEMRDNNCPVAPTAKSEWFKWINLVRKHRDLPPFSYRDKVASRIGKNSLSIPLEKGERFWVYLGVLLSFIVLIAAGLAGGFVLAFFFFGALFSAAFVLSLIWGAIAGFFGH